MIVANVTTAPRRSPKRAVTLVSGPTARVRVTSGGPCPRPRHRPRPVAGGCRRAGSPSVLGVWVVAVGGALLIASALDSPGGRRAPATRPRPWRPARWPCPAAARRRRPSLPPLALVLDRPLPDGIADLPPIRQAARLSELAQADPDPRRLVELGSVLQLLGQRRRAPRAPTASALRRAPRRTSPPGPGLAMVAGASRRRGPGAAPSPSSPRSPGEHPDSQLVAFNQGWVEIYRRRAAPAEEAWKRTIALGPDDAPRPDRRGPPRRSSSGAPGPAERREPAPTGTSSAPHHCLTEA